MERPISPFMFPTWYRFQVTSALSILHRLTGIALVSALELANLAEQAVVIAHSAGNRTESRGAHAREDYPKRDDQSWLKHTVAWKDQDCNIRFEYRPVRLNMLTNEVQSFPPAERTH
jgi:succinate dehydrogenase / fumarate reductase flavoprotein subunit